MNPSLLADFYELTMMQGYFLREDNPRAVFDMFFRRQPFGGGFAVFAGLQTLLEFLASLRFTAEDLAYLQETGVFRPAFLDYLSSFRFRGDVWAMDEGTLAFPGEPLVRVHGSLIETQFVESALLAILNYQTLVATKAARVALAARGADVMEFGLRRAPGVDGALSASRAAFIGGAAATSNTLAGKLYGIPVRGTMAHSWVMSFPGEREAFEAYARAYPDAAVLLIDTYDTLGSGIANAIRVGTALRQEGHRGFGVRLDSGDLEYLSKRVREQLDAAGLRAASIVASNELDEQIIEQLVAHGAPIDTWGVGTSIVTGAGDGALSGVYKIAARHDRDVWLPTIKISNNPEKVTNPGIKQVYRFRGPGEEALADLITLEDERITPGERYTFHHPMGDARSFVLQADTAAPLLRIQMKDGRPLADPPALADLQARARRDLARLDDTYKRRINPHVYKVSLSDRLHDLKARMVQETLSQGGAR